MNEVARIVASPQRLRLRVEDFELLADHGAFDDHGKTELLDGDVYFMNAQWARHSRIKVNLLVEIVNRLRATTGDLTAFCEASVRLGDHDMPEPDITVARWPGDRAIPVETVVLVVEVADTTLDRDLGRKLALYAAAHVPEYWVVDVEAARILVHADPAADTYRQRREVPFGAPLAAATIPALDLGTVALLD